MMHLDIFEFILKNTQGVGVVVELGAGKFDKLLAVQPTVKRRIGIEVQRHPEEVDDPRLEKHYGNLWDWNDFVMKHECECVMLLDLIEHLERCDADRLFSDLRLDFKRVLVFTPLGFRPQGPVEDNPWNVHRSGWDEQDFVKRGFTTWAEPIYNGGALYGRWDSPV